MFQAEFSGGKEEGTALNAAQIMHSCTWPDDVHDTVAAVYLIHRRNGLALLSASRVFRIAFHIAFHIGTLL